MRLVRVGVRRHYQQGNPVAVEPENFDGVDRLEAVSVEPYRSPASGEFRGCFRPFVELYITRSMRPSRTDSTASRSGSSAARSSLRGHHAPSTYPLRGALGFKRNAACVPVCSAAHVGGGLL